MAAVVCEILIGPKKQIGSTYRLEARMKEHLTALEKGSHYNKHMQNAYKKYNSFSYKVLSVHGTREEAYIAEQVLLNKYFGTKNYLMVSSIATAPPVKLGIENSFSRKEVKLKALETKKQQGLLKRSEEAKRKISLANRGRKQSEEEKVKREKTLVTVRSATSYREALIKGCKEEISRSKIKFY